MKYLFIGITPSTTLTRISSTCSINGSNKTDQSISKGYYYYLFKAIQLRAKYVYNLRIVY